MAKLYYGKELRGMMSWLKGRRWPPTDVGNREGFH